MEREFDRKNLQRPHMTNYPLRRMNDRFDTYNPARPGDLTGVTPTQSRSRSPGPAGGMHTGPRFSQNSQNMPHTPSIVHEPSRSRSGTPSCRSSRSTSYTPQSPSYSPKLRSPSWSPSRSTQGECRESSVCPFKNNSLTIGMKIPSSHLQNKRETLSGNELSQAQKVFANCPAGTLK